MKQPAQPSWPLTLLEHALAATFLIAAATPAQAQVSIGAGGSVALGGGTLAQDCTALQVDGTAQVQGGQWTGIANAAIGAGGALHGGSGTLQLAGQFAGGAGFAPGTGTVRFADGCGLAGAGIGAGTSFYTLDVATAQGRTLTLPAGATQTVQHRLVLAGAAGQPLRVRSSTAGAAAFTALQPGASQSVAFVDVADNHATAQVIAPGTAAQYQSTQGGNVQQWFVAANNNGGYGTPTAIPTLGHGALALLSALLGAWALWRRRFIA